MCGAVIVTICLAYDGSVKISWYPVIPVLKQTSPNVFPIAPNALPKNVAPSSSIRIAGKFFDI